MLLVQGYCEKAPFRHLSNHVSRSPKFRKYISYESLFFFENVQNLIKVLKLQKKNGETFFVSEIIASELVALN